MRRTVRLAHCALALWIAWGATAARAEDAPACLPDDFQLRVKFAEPKQLAETLAAVEKAKRRAGKREVLARRFREVGCASVEGLAGEGNSEPNLVCRIAGRNSKTIVLGTSPQFDGWPAAALLPEIARSVAASAREHSYAFAVFSRVVRETPAGARAFMASAAADPPASFLHVGSLGAALPQIGPESGEGQRCVLQAVARGLGLELEAMRGWEQISVPCAGSTMQGRSHSPAFSCKGESFGRFLDTDAFIRAEVPVAGVYAYLGRDRTNFAMPKTPRFDAAAYVMSYRVLAAYAVALDRVLAAPASAPPPEPVAAP